MFLYYNLCLDLYSKQYILGSSWKWLKAWAVTGQLWHRNEIIKGTSIAWYPRFTTIWWAVGIRNGGNDDNSALRSTLVFSIILLSTGYCSSTLGGKEADGNLTSA